MCMSMYMCMYVLVYDCEYEMYTWIRKQMFVNSHISIRKDVKYPWMLTNSYTKLRVNMHEW